MISATKGLAVESQPLITGLPAAQAARMPFGTMACSSDYDLGQLDVQIVEHAFKAALPAHAARFYAAERRLGSRQGEAVHPDHASLDTRDRLADPLGIARKHVGRQTVLVVIGA